MNQSLLKLSVGVTCGFLGAAVHYNKGMNTQDWHLQVMWFWSAIVVCKVEGGEAKG